MPSIRGSSRPNLKGWKPVQNQPSAEPEKTSAPTAPDPLARSPFMHASMPLIASTGDAFVRQFYTNANLPQQRIFPAGIRGPKA
jgi:hypothetical protein